jgi:hypothetical protein
MRAASNGLDGKSVVCRCVNGAWKFMKLTRAIYLENTRFKTHIMHILIYRALCEWARVLGIGEGRGRSNLVD